MNKIIILHRDDLYGLTRNEPIANIVYESFPDPLLKFLDADFIAFEDDRTGILKILKNNFGACVMMPCASFYTAIQIMTGPNAMNPFSNTQNELPANGALMVINKPNPEKVNPKPNYRIGFDPAVVGADVSAFSIQEKGVSVYMDRDDRPEEIQARAALFMKNYYGDMIIDNAVFYINDAVSRAIEAYKFGLYSITFPENLSEAILFFNPKFDNIFKVMFEQGETYFCSTLNISYPEIYGDIIKECGFWCEDTKLFKAMKAHGCSHDDCMINTILKGIFRFRTQIANFSKQS